MPQTREMIQDGIADAKTENSVVKPYVMSHGTMECYSLKDSRRFYEEFLGLECVRHAKPAMVVRCGLKFHIVAVEVGAAVHPCNVLNHWGLDVGSKEEVDKAHQNALKHQDKYKIRQVLPVVMQHGVYSFYMEDLDHNWSPDARIASHSSDRRGAPQAARRHHAEDQGTARLLRQ